jgi:hypothetical protein
MPKRKRIADTSSHKKSPEPPSLDIPEWLEMVRLTVEHEAPIMQTLMIRAVSAVLIFSRLSEDSALNATAAPTDLAVLVRALSSGELLEDLKQAEPLAPAFIRGIEAKRRLIEENGGTLTAEQAGGLIGISRQGIDKRRTQGKLLALAVGHHGYRYPVWQFTKSGTLRGLEDVLGVLGPFDEWMQIIFFVSENPRLQNRTPIELLKRGELKQVLDAAQSFGEHGAV